MLSFYLSEFNLYIEYTVPKTIFIILIIFWVETIQIPTEKDYIS